MLASSVGKSVLWQSIYTTIKKQSYSTSSKALPRNTEQPRDSSHLLRGRRPKSKPLLWIRSSAIPSSILCTHMPVFRRWRHAAIHPPASPCFAKMGVSLMSRSAGAFAGTYPAVILGEVGDTLSHSCKTLATCLSPAWHNGERQGHPGPSSSQGVRPEARKPSDPSAVPLPGAQAVPLRWWPCKSPLLAPHSSSHSELYRQPHRWLPVALLTVQSCCDSSLEIQNFSFQNFLRAIKAFLISRDFSPRPQWSYLWNSSQLINSFKLAKNKFSVSNFPSKYTHTQVSLTL